MRAHERAVRVHRAYVEGYLVTPLSERSVACAYRVLGASGAPYVVDVLDRSGAHDTCTCTCPDFLGNQLGTCKHIEAVRRVFETRPMFRRAYAKLGEHPEGAAPSGSSSMRVAPCSRSERFEGRTRGAAVGRKRAYGEQRAGCALRTPRSPR